MNTSVKALVLKVQQVGENDRLCTLLAERFGVIRAWARGANNMKNKNFAATAQFVFGTFEMYYSKDRWIIDESSFDELFIRLRDDIDKLALGQYLCELAAELASENESTVYLQIMKTALYLLANSKRPAGVIKAAAEMRLMALSGYMPDLVMCSGCGAYEAETMFFNPRTGTIRCDKCGPDGMSLPLSRGALAAMRHTIYVDIDKTFSFELAEPSLRQLCAASEGYLLEQTGRGYTTLDFLKSLQFIGIPETDN